MKRTIFFLFFFIQQCVFVSAQQSFSRETIEIGNIGLSVTNAGTVGRPDVRNDPQGPPSMEYPLNTGIEHLFEGGLWIGAKVNGQVAVSTASVDATGGYVSGASGFEFSAEQGNTIKRRSKLTSDDNFSFDAVSHEDYLIDFSDSNTIIPGTSIQITDHDLPLKAGVHLETYAWNFSFADFFVIMKYEITNNSTNNWDSVYLGLWTDLVVRNVNVATDAGAAFFNKGGEGVLDSMFALYKFDVNGDPGYTESYGAMQFLGTEWRNQFIHPNNSANVIANGYPAPEVNKNFWIFKQYGGAEFDSPLDDLTKYDRLNHSHHDFTNPGTIITLQSPSNRTQLISTGPLVQVAPGESFSFVIAIVCAKQLSGTSDCALGISGQAGPDKDVPCARTELADHLGWAKRTYLGEDVNENGLLDAGEDLDLDNILDRYILPEPPATPNVKFISSSNAVDIYWGNASEFSVDPISKKMDFEGYRIYRTNAGDDLNLDLIGSAQWIAQWDKSGNAIGYNNGFSEITLSQPLIEDGDTFLYHFHNEGLLNGWQYLYIVTAFDEGNEDLNLESLESSFVENAFSVWAGTSADSTFSEIGVYPNPYKLSAAWDGSTDRTRKIIFFNLPPHCEIVIYTLGGDVVAAFSHDAETYSGDDIEWFANYGGDQEKRIFSGGEHAWDLLSESQQTITQGLYLFSVKDMDSGIVHQGKFAVLR